MAGPAGRPPGRSRPRQSAGDIPGPGRPPSRPRPLRPRPAARHMWRGWSDAQANPIRGKLTGCAASVPRAWNFPGLPVSNSATIRPEWPGRSGLAIVGAAPVAEDLAVPSAARPGSWQDVEDREATLVARCAQGDEAACADLVAEHQRMVFQLAYHLLGDRDEALDLSQEVFCGSSARSRSSAASRSCAPGSTASSSTRPATGSGGGGDAAASSQVSLDQHVAQHGDLGRRSAAWPPDRLFARKELGRRLWAALESLPFDQRTAIVLREMDGLSYDEIAFSLGVTLGTVKSRLTRARQALRVGAAGGAAMIRSSCRATRRRARGVPRRRAADGARASHPGPSARSARAARPSADRLRQMGVELRAGVGDSRRRSIPMRWAVRCGRGWPVGAPSRR